MVIVRACSSRLPVLGETLEFCGYVRCLTLEGTSRAKGLRLKIEPGPLSTRYLWKNPPPRHMKTVGPKGAGEGWNIKEAIRTISCQDAIVYRV